MKKPIFKAALAVGAAALASCSTQEFTDNYGADSGSDRKNEYTQNWIDRFGLFDTEHDWSTLTSVKAEISGEYGTDAVTYIYNADPQAGGHLIGFTREPGQLALDLPKDAKSVYAVVTDGKGVTLLSGEFDVAQGAVVISSARAHAPELSRAAHTPSFFDAMVVCEDLGGIGDYDFNDIVLGLRHVSGTNTLKVMPMAAGGMLAADVYYDGKKIGEIHDMIEPGSSASSMLNTHSFSKVGKMQNITVSDFSLTDGWKKISLMVKDADETVEINAPDKKGVAPQMFCLGGDWYWPTERTSIDDAYTGFASWTADASSTTWADAYSDISKVVTWDVSQVATNWFSGTTSDGAPYTAKINNATNVSVNSDKIYTLDPPTSLASMFSGASTLTSLDLAADHFDTSLANSLSSAFRNCSSLTSLDLSNWDTSNVTTMDYMFYGCSSLTDLNLSGFKTTNVNNIAYMFRECTALKNLDISNWDISNVPNSSTNVFDVCTNLESVTMNNWINSSNSSNLQAIISSMPSSVKTIIMQNCEFPGVTDLGSLFSLRGSGLTTLDVTGWKTPDLTSLYKAFYFCTGLETITGINTWKVPKVSDLSYAFRNCSKLKELDLSNWDTSNVTTMEEMFYGCSSLTDLNLSGFKTSSLNNIAYMFRECTALKNLNISNWDISNVPNSSTNVFDVCTSLESVTMNNWVNTSTKSNLQAILSSMPSSVKTIIMQNCNFSGVTDLDNVFSGRGGKLTTLDVTGWKTPDLTSLYKAFDDCTGLETITGINTWQVPKITDLSYAFRSCSKLKELDLSNWNTSTVTSMLAMFYDCSSLMKLNISHLDISNVTNFSYMFYNCPENITITCTQATKDKLISTRGSSLLPKTVNWVIVP